VTPFLKAQAEGDLAGLEAREAQGRIHGHLEDLLRRLLGDLLDLHAALGGGHEGDAAGDAVHEEGEVELPVDVHGIADEDRVDLAALGAGLLGDQVHAQHRLEDLRGLVGIGSELDAAPLAPAAGVDLGLDDGLPAVLLGDHAGVLGVLGHPPVGRRDLVQPEQFLGLVLVDVHPGLPIDGRVSLSGKAGPVAHEEGRAA
jgi:hypothetical protein